MSQQEEKSFFDRIGEILNAPLPGTQAPEAPRPPAEAGAEKQDDDPSLLERIKEILNTPLPGAAQASDESAAAEPQVQPGTASAGDAGVSTPAQPASPPATGPAGASAGPRVQTPELDEDDLEEHWWKQDWAAFRAHQSQERGGLEQKQRGDLAKFTAYQTEEKRRFEAHQAQELDLFRQQQQWRLHAWKQALAANPGSRPPPPPWGMPGAPGMMPPGAPPMGGPRPGPMGPPPWMRPPGPRRGR